MATPYLKRALHLALLLALAAAVAAGLAAWSELPRNTVLAGGLIIFTVGSWATGALPEFLTSLVFFLTAMLLAIAPPAVVFSGFTSNALWLVFGGLVLAGAVDLTGLGRALAVRIAGGTDRAYWQIIAGLVTLAMLLAFLVPSTMGRVLLMVPLVLALADRMGYPRGSKGRTGMLLAPILATYLVACTILPANVPNLVLIGASETVLGNTIRYGDYFLLHFPVLGALKAVLLVAIISLMFGHRPEPEASPPVAAGAPALDDRRVPGPARLLAVVLLVTLACWATDSLHGISPAWVALAAAIICLWPGAGLLPADALARHVSLVPFVYVSGVLGVARLIDASGLGAWLSDQLLAVLPVAGASDGLVFASLSSLAVVIGMVATMPAIPATLTSLAPDVSQITGWSDYAVTMTQVMGYSTVVLPYQVPPLIVGMAISGVPVRSAVRTILILAAVTVVLLWPLAFLWWHVLGVI
ncbi:MAG: anion permease [Rhodospirillaceae bacterium]|nr:anion permease [Rhodospirillaceae bacterium]